MEKLGAKLFISESGVIMVQANWLVNDVTCRNVEDFDAGDMINDLLEKNQSIADKPTIIHRYIEYDLITFCESKGKDMSKFRAALELQDQGMRIRMQSKFCLNKLIPYKHNS